MRRTSRYCAGMTEYTNKRAEAQIILFDRSSNDVIPRILIVLRSNLNNLQFRA